MMNDKTRKLTETALLIALGTILSLIQFPGPWVNGGSITLCSMLPICIIGYRYGVRWGILGGVVYGLLQLLLGVNALRGISLATVALSVLLDYLLAFGVGILRAFPPQDSKPVCGFYGWGRNCHCAAVLVPFYFRSLCVGYHSGRYRPELGGNPLFFQLQWLLYAAGTGDYFGGRSDSVPGL